ncbi:MAG: PHP-associated domain-containing protein [Verrucomicrobiota bacterium]
MPAYKVDLHNHCDCDPIDQLSYSYQDLIDKAHEQGVDALAITPHRDPFPEKDIPDAIAYAQNKGMLFIPGVERYIDGREVIILNAQPSYFSSETQLGQKDLRKIRQEQGDAVLTIAPHPFYPRKTCVGRVLDQIKDLIDALEFSHMYFPFWNPNTKAEVWAKANNKPVVANSDSHNLHMIGKNSSIVEADSLTTEAIFSAIRNHHVRYEIRYMTVMESLAYLSRLFIQVTKHALVMAFKRPVHH